MILQPGDESVKQRISQASLREETIERALPSIVPAFHSRRGQDAHKTQGRDALATS